MQIDVLPRSESRSDFQQKVAIMTPNWRLLSLLLIALCVPALAAKKATSARKEDVKFIKCAVCGEIVDQLHARASQGQKHTEFQLIEITENVCNLKRDDGTWIMRLDIVEAGQRLDVVRQEQEGECGVECKTIERACQEVMGDYDTDVAEFMFNKRASKEALHKFLCKDLSGVCTRPPPPVPKDREPGPAFVAKSSKDAEIERLMRSMSDMPGAGGMKMYSKDDLLNMPGVGKEVDDEEDDEDGFLEDDDDDDEGKAFAAAAKGRGKGSTWNEKLWKRGGSLLNVVSGSSKRAYNAAMQQLEKWGASAKSLLRGIAPRAANAEL